ncbi:hypothetical protein GCM10010978_28520 [Compostibacillus humi]|uniref:DUF3137 domain-containing protein n=1 Tax=Compostibacillus humi TaxID=1245525 RepID=A0A8J2XG67_9BACI|nr:hypothetical protein [Compostibacillus humi]GFZ86924.1 hypothetical protein GCM10010978_28520 [Compostibacillus humi]
MENKKDVNQIRREKSIIEKIGLLNTKTIEAFYPLPEFRIPERFDVYDRIEEQIGLGKNKTLRRSGKAFFIAFIFLGIGFLLQHSIAYPLYGLGGLFLVIAVLAWFKKPNASLSIYRSYHQWNKNLTYSRNHYNSVRIDRTKNYQNHGFMQEGDPKIISQYLCHNFFLQNGIETNDEFSLVMSKEKNVYTTEDHIGIELTLMNPYVKANEIKTAFYLLPEGFQPKGFADRGFFEKEIHLNGYQLFVTESATEYEIQEVVKLIQPLLDRNWKVFVFYHAWMIQIYLPEFLPNMEEIQTRDQLMKCCRRFDAVYSFYERSLIWRHGDISTWKKGERKE